MQAIMSTQLQRDWVVEATDEHLLRLFITTKKLGLKFTLRIFNQHFPKHQDMTQRGHQLYQQLLPYQANLDTVLLPYQKNILFGSTSQETLIDDLDISLLIKILQQTSDRRLKSLKKLQEFRNWLAHQGGNVITDAVFIKKFSQLKANLLNLGATNDEVEYFKTAKLDVSDSKKLETIKELLQQIRDEEKPTVEDLVLQQVLHIVAREIGDDWQSLATSLKVCLSLISQYDKTLKSFPEKMTQCFISKFNNISWKELKKQLIKINRKDIVKILCKETHLTTGLQEAANILSDQYIQEFSTSYKNDTYFDLLLCRTTEEERSILKKKNPSSTISNNIDTKHFIEKSDSVNLLRGTGGSGKTTFLCKQTLDWARKKTLNGASDSPNIKFLFRISCNELEQLNTDDTLCNIIENKFPKVFDNVTFDDIRQFNSGVLLLIDGFDCACQYEKCEDMCRVINEHIKKNLYGDKICIACRPGKDRHIYQMLLSDVNVKLVDVMGFSPTSIDKFVTSYFAEDRTKYLTVKRMIDENVNLKSISSIPGCLRILCSLVNSAESTDDLNSCTSLCLTASLLFIQNYYKTAGLSDLSFQELCTNKIMIKTILCLAGLSFIMLREGKNYISHQELEKYDLQVDDGGLFLLFEKTDGKYYQFKNLLLIEFFSGLQIFLMGDLGLNLFGNIDSKSTLLHVLPTVGGLFRIFRQHRQDSKFLQALLRKLIKTYGRSRQFLKAFVHSKEYISRQECVKEDRAFNFVIRKTVSFIEGSTLSIDEKWYPLLSSLYEYQSSVPEILKQYLEQATCINISIKFHCQLLYVVYLFNRLSIDHMTCCDIIMADNSISDKELDHISYLVTKCEKVRVWNTTLNWGLLLKIALSETTVFPFKALVLNNCELTSADKSYLLQYIPMLSSFMVAKVHFTKAEFEILAANILKARDQRKLKLCDVYVWRCNISNDALNVLIKIVPYLKDFAIALNPITTESIRKLSESLITANRNTRLDLSLISCGLTDQHIQELVGCLRHVKELVLYGNKDLTSFAIGQISNEIIDRAVSCNGLRTTGLGFSHLTDDHIEELAQCCPYLSGLSLYKCDQMTESSFKAMLKCFKLCNNKKRGKLHVTLDVDCVMIKDVSVKEELQCYVNFDFEEDTLECIM